MRSSFIDIQSAYSDASTPTRERWADSSPRSALRASIPWSNKATDRSTPSYSCIILADQALISACRKPSIKKDLTQAVWSCPCLPARPSPSPFALHYRHRHEIYMWQPLWQLSRRSLWHRTQTNASPSPPKPKYRPKPSNNDETLPEIFSSCKETRSSLVAVY